MDPMPDTGLTGLRNEGIWKNIALFLAGIVFSGAGWLATMAHDSISRIEVDEKLREAYAASDKQNRDLSDRLSRMEQSQSQMGRDVGQIAGRLGVTARPVTPN